MKWPSLAPRWIWLAAAVLVIAAGGAVYALSRPSADSASKDSQRKGRGGFDPSRPMPVVAAAARAADMSIYLNGLGTVTPLKTVTVRSRVDGELIRVLFTEGQVVRAGDLLVEVDPRPYQVQLTQAEGQMVRDQALLANARIDFDRYRTLYAQDSIAKQQVDTQEALVRQYEGVVKMDQGQIDNARLQLVYARITAPISGRLGLRQVDPGNIVHASDANGVVVITQLQPITVVFTIPQDSLPAVMKRVQGGDKLPADAWDREGRVKLASGTLLTVDNQIDTTTGTVKLKAQFGNDDGALFPNQFVNVRLLVDTRQGVTVVPGAAVQRGAQGTFVYVVKDDLSVSVRAVRLGPSEGGDTAIENGIAPGGRVVVDGVDRLREGAKVELAAREAAAAPAAGDDRAKKGFRKKKGPE